MEQQNLFLLTLLFSLMALNYKLFEHLKIKIYSDYLNNCVSQKVELKLVKLLEK